MLEAELARLLACPDCGGAAGVPGSGGEAGRLECAACGRVFPVERGAARMLPRGALDGRARRTRAGFAWEWERYPGALEEDRRVFLEETQITAPDWRDKLVLDAGCGMGRYAEIALALGAEVIALDLSDALFRLSPKLGGTEGKLHLVQGDLLHPPLKPETFDIVYSLGVLHHTPDAAASFRRVATLVKRGGLLSVWVYGTPGSYSSFRSNPLRPDRARLKRVLPAVWAVVWARRVLSDGLRKVTTRLPIPVLYALCFPLAALGAAPALKYLTFSVHRDFRVRWIENFDWLSPPYQSKHTKEEVEGWFEAAGFDVVRRLEHGMVPKVGMLGRRR